MKKMRNLILTSCLIASLGFMMFPTATDAQVGDPPSNGESWVCCKSLSDGCETMDGMYFETDFKYYAPACVDDDDETSL